MAGEEKASKGVVGMVRALRWILWGLLLAAVVVTLQGPAGFPAAQGATRVAALALVGLFVVGYAVYRFTLVRAGRYPAGKAMVQIALMSLVFTLILGRGMETAPPQPPDRPVDLLAALASGDHDLRALAAEVAGARPRAEARAFAPRLVELLGDRSPEVRRQARRSLAAIVGRDLGEGPGAAEAWRGALAAPSAP
jgi:hypothetical protein